MEFKLHIGMVWAIGPTTGPLHMVHALPSSLAGHSTFHEYNDSCESSPYAISLLHFSSVYILCEIISQDYEKWKGAEECTHSPSCTEVVPIHLPLYLRISEGQT